MGVKPNFLQYPSRAPNRKCGLSTAACLAFVVGWSETEIIDGIDSSWRHIYEVQYSRSTTKLCFMFGHDSYPELDDDIAQRSRQSYEL